MDTNDDTRPRYRSAAVARMLRMPVATLRIWERRYRVAAPALSPAGHRLYSAADVRRLALVRQLTERGHAIGSVAALDLDALHAVAATHANTLAGPGAPPAACEAVAVGAALAARLQQPGVRLRLARPWRVLMSYDDLAAAAAAVGAAPAAGTGAASRPALLVVHVPGLHADRLGALQALQQALGARGLAVLYRFASAAARRAFEAAGCWLCNDGGDDAALAAWLDRCAEAALPPEDAPPRAMPASAIAPASGPGRASPPPRRYDDATLAEFAGLSSAVACECPQHVADLLMRLSAFEAYSAECAHRSPGDAALHAELQHVAGSARALFEQVLEQLLVAEGLLNTPAR
jgi:DNA-binding transcriptional MerR regulator